MFPESIILSTHKENDEIAGEAIDLQGLTAQVSSGSSPKSQDYLRVALQLEMDNSIRGEAASPLEGGEKRKLSLLLFIFHRIRINIDILFF